MHPDMLICSRVRADFTAGCQVKGLIDVFRPATVDQRAADTCMRAVTPLAWSGASLWFTRHLEHGFIYDL